MENFIRITFWIVIFYACCRANSLPLRKEDSNISLMKEDVTCEQSSRFYTPTNVESNCITAALQCFRAELQTVRDECEDPQEVINQAEEFLTDLIIRRNRTSEGSGNSGNSTRCPCEVWPKKPFSNYLEGLETLVELLISVSRM